MKSGQEYGIMFLRETLYSLLIYKIWARDQKEVTNMNKYELAVVVSAKIDRKSTRLNSSHVSESRMPSSA